MFDVLKFFLNVQLLEQVLLNGAAETHRNSGLFAHAPQQSDLRVHFLAGGVDGQDNVSDLCDVIGKNNRAKYRKSGYDDGFLESRW